MEPYYRELLDHTLDEATAAGWLSDWSHLRKLVDESYSRLQLENSQDTTDQKAEARYLSFIENVYPSIQSADQKLKEKFLASGLDPDGFEIPLRNMRTEADLFREANLPLIAHEYRLGSQYNKIAGAQTVLLDGEENTIQQLRPKMLTDNRQERERIWRLSSERQLADRGKINDLWKESMGVRSQLAANAGLPDYRSYRWRLLLRFDYTPENCAEFHRAIETVAVPAATRIYEKHRRRLGIDRIRPWDLDLDIYPINLPLIHAYETTADLESTAEAVFKRVHPRLGDYYGTMRREKLLDLENRKGKSPGAFCTSFAVEKRPFVFMNAVGLSGDVRTLLHECGHAFHVFERVKLPYHHQWRTGMEFSEVASMAMELLPSPYLAKSEGGFFSDQEASRVAVEHLERIILFWPYMAVVDAFQHWVYENHQLASDPANCDRAWTDLWQRFIPAEDWSGFEDALATGWHRKLHIHRYPFYYVEYGLAQLGAVQVWRKALSDQHGAVEAYLKALALGGTVPLPQLFATAGGKFAFDRDTMNEAVSLIENRISQLEA